MLIRYLIVLLVTSTAKLGFATITCDTFKKLSHDREYFYELLASWPQLPTTKNPSVATIKNQIGLTLENPRPIERFEVLNTAWDEVESSANIIAKAQAEMTLVRWSTFREAFRNSINDFQKQIGGRDYAMLVPARSSSNNSPKSNHFLSGIAVIEEGLRPKRIVQSFRELEGIRNLVIIDDGSYSGWQLQETIDNFIMVSPDGMPLHIHLVVPYVSKIAKSRVEPFLVYNARVSWYDQNLIRSVEDVDWPKGDVVNIEDVLHLTIFEHKIPDNLSTLPVKVKIGGKWYSNTENEGLLSFEPRYKEPLQMTDLSELMNFVNK